MHPLLARQLRKLQLDAGGCPSPGEWAAFVDAVDRTYAKADQDRYTLERSLEVSSAEMQQLYTDLQRASASDLAREHDRMQAMFASLGEGLFVLTPDARIADINPEGLRLLGGGSVDAVGRPWREVIAVDAETAGPELPLRDADGTVRRPDGTALAVRLSLNPVVHEGEAIGAVLVFRDVTGRKRQEDLLRESNDRYRSLVRNASHGICEVRGNGQLLAVNLALVTMLGYDSEDEMLALDVDTLQRRGLKPSEIARACGEGERVENLELEWTRKDGRAITVRVGGRSVPGGPEGVPSFELLVEDVTERFAFEGRLRQAQKMEAVGQLAGGIAHDFNNLLTAILGYANLALERTRAGGPLRHEIEEIRHRRRARGRAHAPAARLQPPPGLQPRVLDLNGWSPAWRRCSRRLIGEDVVPRRRSSSPELAAGHGRRGSDRAGDHEPGGERARRDARRRPAHDRDGATSTLDGGYARSHGAAIAPGDRTSMLAVSDTGCGMDAETQARDLRALLHHQGASGKGTGLGLATVYGIVKQSGGYIWVYSEPGRGTTFKVYLPAAARMARSVAAPRTPAPPPRRRDRDAALVEDEPAVRELTCEALRRHGYTVHRGRRRRGRAFRPRSSALDDDRTARHRRRDAEDERPAARAGARRTCARR